MPITVCDRARATRHVPVTHHFRAAHDQCAYDCAQWHTIHHRAVLMIFAVILLSIIAAQMLCNRVWTELVDTQLIMSPLPNLTCNQYLVHRKRENFTGIIVFSQTVPWKRTEIMSPLRKTNHVTCEEVTDK